MRLAIALASLLAMVLLFLALASACARGGDGRDQACRNGDGAQASRSGRVWSLNYRFSLLTLSRLTFPALRNATACVCQR
ncbi:hypothetical protein [Achromobacter anxifer]